MIHISFKTTSKRLFKKGLEEHRYELYKIAWSWCHDVILAEDLVQDTYAKALKNRSQLKDLTKLKPWLARILVNLHADYYRVKRDYVELESQHLELITILLVWQVVKNPSSLFDMRFHNSMINKEK